MRQIPSIVGVVVIVVSTLLSAPYVVGAQQPDTVRTATLAGLVRDSTGAPIADVWVTVGRTRLGAHTSGAGWFTIERVPPGEYNVRFDRLGYGSMTFAWHATAGERTEITIALSSIPRDLDTVVVEGKASSHARGHAEVVGIIVDSADTPLSDAQVEVIGSGRFTLTDADGEFLFPELEPGSYILRIRRLGFVPQSIPITVGAAGRHSLAVRMRPLGLMLDTVEVRAESGFGKDALVWRDFDARLRWARESPRSVTMMGDALRKLGKMPLDLALRYSGQAIRICAVPGLTGQCSSRVPNQLPNKDGTVGIQGTDGIIRDEEASCILVNGKDPEYEPLRAFHADEIEALEVYQSVQAIGYGARQESDFTGSVEARMSAIPACAGLPLGGHPTYYVVWLKGAR